jgi:hypothetical protein
MGLLDEAIREHLELKRRSGADPTTVERAEQEALAPVSPDEEVAMDGNGAELAHEPAAEMPPPDPGAHLDGDAQLADFHTVGQDTAELDMQAVMEEDAEAADPASPEAPIGESPGVGEGSTRPLYSDEMPGEVLRGWDASSEQGHESVPADIPGQERLSFE